MGPMLWPLEPGLKRNILANLYDIATVVKHSEMLQVDLVQQKQSCLDSKPCNDQIVFKMLQFEPSCMF